MITSIISVFGGTILLVFGWLLGGKQKANVELKKNNADATITIQSMYETFALQYREQYNAVLLDVQGLRKQVSDLDLRNAITLEASASWEKKFNGLQKEYDSLKKAFDALKKSMQ